MGKTKAAAAVQSTAILIAVGELSGGGVTLAGGAELTDDLAKEIGLDAEAIADLKARGALVEVQARAASGDGAAELAAAIARAETAEGLVATLTAKVAEFEAAAKPAGAKA